MSGVRSAGRIANLWDRARTSYWFLPSLLAVGSVLLAAGTLLFDLGLHGSPTAPSWLAATGETGARSVLSTIAGSMITVAGVVFSITIVALTLASSQFGPRLLRNLMSDRSNQVVLGTFISIFLYCLIVLRMVGGTGETPFVPHLSVLTALLLAVVGLGVLIYFIHHVTHVIQSTHVVDAIARQIESELEVLFPESLGEGRDESEDGPVLDLDAAGPLRSVDAPGDGYLRVVENDALMALASDGDLRMRLVRRPGDLVVRGSPLAEVAGAVDEETVEAIAGCFVLGEQRTPLQDLPLLFEELAEIAVRALSPGVNDPKTAIECVGGITRGLARLVQRAFPSAERRDAEGVVRVIAPAPRFEDFVAVSLDPIRRHARGEPTVLAALLRAFAEIEARAPSGSRRTAVRSRRDEILGTAEREVRPARDLDVIRAAAEAAADASERRPGA